MSAVRLELQVFLKCLCCSWRRNQLAAAVLSCKRNPTGPLEVIRICLVRIGGDRLIESVHGLLSLVSILGAVMQYHAEIEVVTGGTGRIEFDGFLVSVNGLVDLAHPRGCRAKSG